MRGFVFYFLLWFCSVTILLPVRLEVQVSLLVWHLSFYRLDSNAGSPKSTPKQFCAKRLHIKLTGFQCYSMKYNNPLTLLATLVLSSSAFAFQSPRTIKSHHYGKVRQVTTAGSSMRMAVSPSSSKVVQQNKEGFSIGSLLETLFGDKLPSSPMSNNNNNNNNAKSMSTVEEYLQSLYGNTSNQQRNMDQVFSLVDEDINYIDTAFYNPIVGKSNLKKHLLLKVDALPDNNNNQILVVDDAAYNDNKVCITYHMATIQRKDDDEETVEIPDSTGITFFTLNDDASLITSIFDVVEPPSPKPGSAGLDLLDSATKIIDFTGVGYDKSVTTAAASMTTAAGTENVVERYFECWNRRDMESALDCFAKDCEYNDKQYPEPFSGTDAMDAHLKKIAECLPKSFSFELDDLVVMPKSPSSKESKVGIQRHVENDEDALPFTRGLSFYTTNAENLIQTGLDIPEPAVVKLGGVELWTSSIKSKIQAEPVRLIPLVMWVAYMYIVFFSDGILPGANALQLEQRTWEEVRDLSLNFFLVSPILNLPFAPVVHPMLEGVFNLLLSWAAMFAGFLSDEREEKPNLLPVLPTIAGMQFLTSAFLLPYLVTRSNEALDSNVFEEDLSDPARIGGESRVLGPLLGLVGTVSIGWGLFARPEFGNFHDRLTSFGDLLSIDRVGSSFLVDLAIFGLFQGWLVDDDLRRRGYEVEDLVVLRNVAKFVPFFGLAAYLIARPSLPSRQDA